MKIEDVVPEEELLAQLTEECCELAQAALKLRRSLSGISPTPKSERECREQLTEEIADVELCIQILGLRKMDSLRQQSRIMDMKLKRWKERLVANEGR